MGKSKPRKNKPDGNKPKKAAKKGISGIEIRYPADKGELQQCLDLRYRVLKKPWGQPRGSERDEFDSTSFHAAAFYMGKVIGTARIQKLSTDSARLRCMAVEEKWRNKGVGKMLLQRVEEKARDWGARKIILNAREDTVPFYEKNGYTNLWEVEKLFDVIRHFRMEKELQGFNNAKQL